MFKAGTLPAPVIQPLRYDTIGTRIKVDSESYIQIRSDVPATKIYFTTDGTKPDPFQTGRTGKASSHKYIGPFRLQPGNRVVRAIVVSRDRLRESPVATKYIEVVVQKQETYNYSDHEQNYSSYSDDEPNEFMKSSSKKPEKEKVPDLPEIQGSLEGPINPVNYSGTQINVWGFPTPELANFLQPREPQPNLGFLTEQMIKNLNTPRPIEQAPSDFDKLPENLRKLFKQILKLYERDTRFQNGLDHIMESSQLRSADIIEKYDQFLINLSCAKFLVDQPKKPEPNKKEPIIKQPEVEIFDKPAPPPPPPPKPKPKPKDPSPPPKKEEPKLGTYVEELQQQGTIVDAPGFNAENDAEALRKSVKGFGTDEKVIINIMGNRSNAQRLKIKDTYKFMFGRDLVEDLKDDTSGNFKKLLAALLMSPVEFDCMEIRKAIQGLGTDNSALIEILTSRSNKRLKEMSDLYLQLYKKKMEDDVQSDTSGHYRKLLSSIMSASRPETNEVDLNVVNSDVDELIKAGIKKWGTEESKFNTIFGIRSYAHLRQLFEDYQRKTGKSMEDTIKSEMSGNLAKTYLALIANIRSRPAYFAKEIKKSIKGLGTDEHTLNRIIISRCEIDTKQIKEEYEKLFKTTMEKDIQGDVSGDYGKLLLLLIKDPASRTYENADGSPAQPEEPHVIEQVEEAPIEQTPTVVDFSGFNPNDDCERLRKAMKGLGTDEKTIIQILGNRSNKQRQELKKVFTSMFGRDLIKDLHSELSGDFRETIEGMMMTPAEFDAASFKKAIAGLGTDESALVELLTTRSAEQINAAKAMYQTMFGKNLEADVKGDTSGAFKHALVSLLTANRPTGNMVDRTQAKIDAQALLNAGTKKWGTDESKFVTILCTRSYPQLRALFDEYEKLTSKKIEDDIKKECSGDLLKIFSGIIECVKDSQAYFASRLLKAMKGLGTKESTVIRVVVSRSEIDMVQIKQKFQLIAKSSLVEFLKGDLSGDFLKTILTLIGEESAIKK